MEPDYEAMARQLAKPEGEDGIRTGHIMQEGNAGICRKAMDSLALHHGDHILEIGPGNGTHISHLFNRADIVYRGLDISETMVAQARELNAAHTADKRAQFTLGDGTVLPYPDAVFDHVFTVNTLYFWENPDAQLSEIYRVLKPGGTFCLAFRSRAFMQDLPFTSYGFRLYDKETALSLLVRANFVIKNAVEEDEAESTSITGAVLRKDRIIITGSR